MNPNRYTEKTKEALLSAQQIAERGGNPEIAPEHLLLALLSQREGVVPAVLGKMNIDAGALAAEGQVLVDNLPKVQGGAQPELSARLRSLLTSAEQEAER